MADYATLKTSIQAAIKQNGNNEITGPILQQALLAMINSLGAGYQFMGVAKPTDTPIDYSDLRCFWIASTPGIYTNFGGVEARYNRISVISYDGTWHISDIDVDKWLFVDTLLKSGTSPSGTYPELLNIVPTLTYYNDYTIYLHSSSQIVTLSIYYYDGGGVQRFVTIAEYPEQDTPIRFNTQELNLPVATYHLYCQLASSGSVTYQIYQNAPFASLEREIRGERLDNAKILVLGDSYSQAGYWIAGMREWLPSSVSVVNMGVTNATIKDKYADLVSYPYTSRPVSTDNSGNKNTFACQVEKIKRLMAGSDLDPGESAIYQSPEDYPDIIIIEGGMNDELDSNATVDTYYSQFVKRMENVYRKKRSDATATQGVVYIQTPKSEVNRLCFAGAYRNLAEELLALFPNAQIFITTVSGMGYWEYDVTQIRYKQAVQQRMCANLLGFSCIDWSAEGQINSVVNFPSGSGTSADPYIWNAETTQTSDLMHPKSVAAKRYGRLAALVIRSRFMDIKTM